MRYPCGGSYLCAFLPAPARIFGSEGEMFRRMVLWGSRLHGHLGWKVMRKRQLPHLTKSDALRRVAEKFWLLEVIQNLQSYGLSALLAWMHRLLEETFDVSLLVAQQSAAPAESLCSLREALNLL